MFEAGRATAPATPAASSHGELSLPAAISCWSLSHSQQQQLFTSADRSNAGICHVQCTLNRGLLSAVWMDSYCCYRLLHPDTCCYHSSNSRSSSCCSHSSACNTSSSHSSSSSRLMQPGVQQQQRQQQHLAAPPPWQQQQHHNLVQEQQQQRLAMQLVLQANQQCCKG